MRGALLLTVLAVALLISATACGGGRSNANDLGAYTLQLSDLGALYKQTAAHPVSNAQSIKHGTPAAIVHRFGRAGGYERTFESKDPLQSDLLGVTSRVVSTRTAAGSHGAFLYSTARSRVDLTPKQGLRLHPIALPGLGDESRCYYLDHRQEGYPFRAFFCFWRQGRLIAYLFAGGFKGDIPLLPAVKRVLAKQDKRMGAFHQ
jgi:hypothetical protein